MVALVALVVLVFPWIRLAHEAIPDPAAAGNPGFGADARLILWILAWDVHALATDVVHLFAGNFYHPAPSVLARSEPLLSAALLSAPVQWTTGNTVLAASSVALAAYVLGAVFMYAALRNLAISVEPAAFGAALAFLGTLRVPADLHALQYPNWVLLAVLVATIKVERAFSALRAILLAFATMLAVFSSYYVALMTGLLLGVEVLLSSASGRVRVALRICLVVAPVVATLALLSREHAEIALERPPAARWTAAGLAQIEALRQGARLRALPSQLGGWIVLGLAALGLASSAPEPPWPAQRRVRWIALALVGLAFGVGYGLWLGSWFLPLPLTWLRFTPVRFLGAHERYLILAQIGVIGLAVEGWAMILRGLAARVRPIAGMRAGATALLALVVCLPPAVHLSDYPLTRLPTRENVSPVYRWLARHPEMPLLEIPGPTIVPAAMVAQADTVYRSTFHWLPLVNGHTGGATPWWISHLIPDFDSLPDLAAVQTVIDLTAVRWILVHRAKTSNTRFEAWERLPDVLPGVTLVTDAGAEPDLLLRIDRAPSRPWASSLARGIPEAGRTLLGTRRDAPLTDEARGRIEVDDGPGRVAPGASFRIRASISNAGENDWPALAPPWADDEGLVALRATWLHLPAGGLAGDSAVPPTESTRPRRDVRAGEDLPVSVELFAPGHPGRYTVELRMEQIGRGPLANVAGATFAVEVAPEGERGQGPATHSRPPRANA